MDQNHELVSKTTILSLKVRPQSVSKNERQGKRYSDNGSELAKRKLLDFDSNEKIVTPYRLQRHSVLGTNFETLILQPPVETMFWTVSNNEKTKFFYDSSSHEAQALDYSYIRRPIESLYAKQTKGDKSIYNKVLSNYHDISVEGMQSPKHSRAQKLSQKQAKPSISQSKFNSQIITKVRQISKQIQDAKEILFHSWIKLIQASNGYESLNQGHVYKYFIGKGNNSALVDRLMKQRWWWIRVDSPTNANFIWTQLKQPLVLEKMSTCNNYSKIVDSTPSATSILPKFNAENLENELGYHKITNSRSYTKLNIISLLCGNDEIIHNHLPDNGNLGLKKKLFKNLSKYYHSKGVSVFDHIPLTFHIEKGLDDDNLRLFENSYTPGSLWIVKPGENTNRGNGILVSSDLTEIRNLIYKNEGSRTYIIQKYIENPLLVNKRKFDIRCYALITGIEGQIQGYFYKEGYLRTSSKEFSLKNYDKYVHLTNDAIQNKSEDYGRYESGNKLSYAEFQRYLNANYSGTDFYTDILPQIEKLIFDSIAATYQILNLQKKKQTFEVFGYDFMIDQQFKVWLIEANTNPCLELSGSYLAKLIPEMLDNALRIALDPLFPPFVNHKKYKTYVQECNLKNDFTLIFSSTKMSQWIN
ncbi:unnamed protein product [Blepharisma stoltei]|uniref:Tubulin-tyrosine ligase n=1 Tax=Blepharisma stoltei TaxID=1481888 RepID=A0AAU9IZL8_9CILI|nr:unnamed protein product [Blepharisma stoltei]